MDAAEVALVSQSGRQVYGLSSSAPAFRLPLRRLQENIGVRVSLRSPARSTRTSNDTHEPSESRLQIWNRSVCGYTCSHC